MNIDSCEYKRLGMLAESYNLVFYPVDKLTQHNIIKI